jgi:MOSC domain-containing protein YiiM
MPASLTPSVVAVSRCPSHSFSKGNEQTVRLLEGIGVEGDTHAGKTDQHRSHVARDPNAPNLRQVHLIHAELHDELNASGFVVAPGQMGENITTRGVDLLTLPAGTRLHLGAIAIVDLTGLRNPCKQLNGIQDGLMNATLEKKPDGTLIRKSGVMAIVTAGGEVRTGDGIRVELPSEPHISLEPV